MKKITILALHLGYGGIENNICTLANRLADKFDVEILCVYRLYSEPAYNLKDNVTVKYITNEKSNKKEMSHYFKNNNFKTFFKGIGSSLKIGFIKYIKTGFIIRGLDSDVIISTKISLNNLVSMYAKKDIRKIAWIHNHHNDNNKLAKKYIKSCKNIDYIVTVSKELEKFYKKYYDKVVYIPNSLENISRKISKLDSTNIISTGKLSKEKAFDDMIKLFKNVSSKYPNWKLNIVGDGMEKDNLLSLVKELKLEDKVIFHGYQDKDTINNLLLDSSIYLMTSHTESFGMGLLEAMNVGIPCISYSSAQGANEIIEDGINGYLIENRDESKMVDTIINLIENEKLRNKIGKEARITAKEYEPEVILDKWCKLANKRK